MAVQITNNTRPGEIYVDERGEVHQVLSYCMSPTVTMENVVTGSQTGGGLGCLNLEPFKPIVDCSKDELVEIVEKLAMQNRAALTKQIRLMEELNELKEKLLAAKYPEHFAD